MFLRKSAVIGCRLARRSGLALATFRSWRRTSSSESPCARCRRTIQKTRRPKAARITTASRMKITVSQERIPRLPPKKPMTPVVVIAAVGMSTWGRKIRLSIAQPRLSTEALSPAFCRRSSQ